MKYDILQLNEMLVGELKEIADRIGVADFKKLGKQDLIYRILDAQALNSAPDSKTPEILVEDNTAYEKIPNAKKEDRTEKRPRKRLSVDDKPERKDATPTKPAPRFDIPTKPDRFAKSEMPRFEPPVDDDDDDNAPPSYETPDDDDDYVNPALIEFDEPIVLDNRRKKNNDRRNSNDDPTDTGPRYNIDLDGVVEGEGVLEMMQDGYGFLRSADYNYMTDRKSVV